MLKIAGVDRIDKLVDTYKIDISKISPYESMKIKIFKEYCGTEKERYAGYTNVLIKRYSDKEYIGGTAVSSEKEDAVKKTIEDFVNLVNGNYPSGLAPDGIKYVESGKF